MKIDASSNIKKRITEFLRNMNYLFWLFIVLFISNGDDKYCIQTEEIVDISIYCFDRVYIE